MISARQYQTSRNRRYICADLILWGMRVPYKTHSSLESRKKNLKTRGLLCLKFQSLGKRVRKETYLCATMLRGNFESKNDEQRARRTVVESSNIALMQRKRKNEPVAWVKSQQRGDSTLLGKRLRTQHLCYVRANRGTRFLQTTDEENTRSILFIPLLFGKRDILKRYYCFVKN